MLFAGVALPALAQNDPGRMSYSRLLNIDALIEAHVRTLTRRYNLSEDQEVYTQAFLQDRANAFLDKHREELFELVDRLVEVRAGGEMDQQELINWGKRALPLYEEAKNLIVQGNNQWRDILTEDQRKTHDEDLQEMYQSFATTEDQLQRIVGGQMTLDEFRKGPARQIPRATTPVPATVPPNRVTPAPAGGPRAAVTPTPQPAAPAAAPSGGTVTAKSSPPMPGGGAGVARGAQPARGRGAAQSQPAKGSSNFESQWETYVREFIQKYQLDEAQTQRAQSILKDCQATAQSIMQKRKDEIEQLDKKLMTLATDAKDADKLKELNEIGNRRNKLLEPIGEIFEKQLKPRLEKLPTRAQRENVEQAGKRTPIGQPTPGKPGKPGRPGPQPQPQPPSPPPPPPPEQDNGP
jgi:hypothetical protein